MTRRFLRLLCALLITASSGCPRAPQGEGEGEGEGEGDGDVGQREVGLLCGAELCPLTEECCVTQDGDGQAEPVEFAAVCTGDGGCAADAAALIIRCDGPEDCGVGEACCLEASANCVPTGQCATLAGDLVCVSTNDCEDGQVCCQLPQRSFELGVCLEPRSPFCGG